MTKIKKLAAFFLAFVLLLSFCGCSAKGEGGILTEDGSLHRPDPVIRFGSFPIHFDYYRYLYLSQRDQLMGENEDFFETYPKMEQHLKDSVFRYCRYLAGFYALLSEYDVFLTSDEQDLVDDRIQTIKEGYESDGGNFEKTLKEIYLTEELYRKLIEEEELETKLQNTLFLNTGAPFYQTDDQVVDYVTKSFCRARHIYCEKEENAQKALNALQKGESFGAVLAKYNEDATMEDLTDGRYFFSGSHESSYDQAAFALKAGEYSGVVSCSDGYYIIYRMEIEEKLIRTDVANFRNMVYSALYDKLLEEAVAEINPVCCALYDSITPGTLR